MLLRNVLLHALFICSWNNCYLFSQLLQGQYSLDPRIFLQSLVLFLFNDWLAFQHFRVSLLEIFFLGEVLSCITYT